MHLAGFGQVQRNDKVKNFEEVKMMKFFMYVFKLFSDLKGMADAINEVKSVEELDAFVLGEKKAALEVNTQLYSEVM